MDFRDREEQSRPVGHILSSMIVRPSESGGSDYETGEVSRQDGSLRPKTKPAFEVLGVDARNLMLKWYSLPQVRVMGKKFSNNSLTSKWMDFWKMQ